MTVRKVAILSKEYPPNVYGGAGVHVEYLSRALARRIAVEMRVFGNKAAEDGSLVVRGYPSWPEASRNTDQRFAGALDALVRSVTMAKDQLDADLVHCHTWYTDLGGLIASKLWGVPYVLTIHSLEPLRPWKEEQLGNAYHLSAWMERISIEQAHAVIAVSKETRADIVRLFDVDPARVHVIHNGIDLDEYKMAEVDPALLAMKGIDPTRPYVLFVGRLTRQKGIDHLLRAAHFLDPSLQIVLCAGAPDTPGILRETEESVAALRSARAGVIWLREALPRADLIKLYSAAKVFCCPSVYEPFGIINLEAMACEVPVVASAVGGIPEVVIPGETGLLVDPDLIPGTFTPRDPEHFARSLADAVNSIAKIGELQRRLGRGGRLRAEKSFSWDAIADKTIALYEQLLVAAE